LFREFFWITPVGEKFRVGARSEVGPIWIQPPPFAFDNDPRFIAVSHEFFCGFFAGNPSDCRWSFRKLNCERLQSSRHFLDVLTARAAAIADGVCHVECRIQAIDAGVVNLDRTGLVVDENVISHLRAPTSVARLHGGASWVIHEHSVIANEIAVTTPEGEVIGAFHLLGRSETGINIGLIVWILVIPLRDAMIQIVVDQIILNE